MGIEKAREIPSLAFFDFGQVLFYRRVRTVTRLISRFVLVSATRLTLMFKIDIGFSFGVRHRLALMSKINIRLTMSRLLIYNRIIHHKLRSSKGVLADLRIIKTARAIPLAVDHLRSLLKSAGFPCFIKVIFIGITSLIIIYQQIECPLQLNQLLDLEQYNKYQLYSLYMQAL